MKGIANRSHRQHAAIAAIGAVEVAAGLGLVLIWSTLSSWAQLCAAWLVVEAVFYLLQCFRYVGASSHARCLATCASLCLLRIPARPWPQAWASALVTCSSGSMPVICRGSSRFEVVWKGCVLVMQY